MCRQPSSLHYPPCPRLSLCCDPQVGPVVVVSSELPVQCSVSRECRNINKTNYYRYQRQDHGSGPGLLVLQVDPGLLPRVVDHAVRARPGDHRGGPHPALPRQEHRCKHRHHQLGLDIRLLRLHGRQSGHQLHLQEVSEETRGQAVLSVAHDLPDRGKLSFSVITKWT